MQLHETKNDIGKEHKIVLGGKIRNIRASIIIKGGDVVQMNPMR